MQCDCSGCWNIGWAVYKCAWCTCTTCLVIVLLILIVSASFHCLICSSQYFTIHLGSTTECYTKSFQNLTMTNHHSMMPIGVVFTMSKKIQPLAGTPLCLVWDFHPNTPLLFYMNIITTKTCPLMHYLMLISCTTPFLSSLLNCWIGIEPYCNNKTLVKKASAPKPPELPPPAWCSPLCLSLPSPMFIAAVLSMYCVMLIWFWQIHEYAQVHQNGNQLQFWQCLFHSCCFCVASIQPYVTAAAPHQNLPYDFHRLPSLTTLTLRLLLCIAPGVWNSLHDSWSFWTNFNCLQYWCVLSELVCNKIFCCLNVSWQCYSQVQVWD